MKKASILLHKTDLMTANEEMLAKQLLFLPEEAESQQKLLHYLKDNCNLSDFTYQNTEYDKDLIIAATPNLGSKQLGVFAAKSFKKGDIVGEIKGVDLFGIQTCSKIKQLVKEYKGNSTYVWQLNLDNKDEYSVVIDLLKSGTSTRWINHASAPNVEVKVICNRRNDEGGKITFDYHAYYVARKKIAFADELTISYGGEYFTKMRPQILRQPPSLINVLKNLAKTPEQEIATSKIRTRDDLNNFFNLLTQRPDMLGKDELKKRLYLDNKLNPKIYDLHQWQDVARFQENHKMELKRSSSYHLFIAPTVRKDGEHRQAVFSGQTIPTGKVLCQLVGEERFDVPKKASDMDLWAIKNNIDLNYLVESSNGGYLYTKTQASEAYCIEGAKYKSESNVRFDFKTNSYMTTREIEAGEEIVAFYEDYDYGASPTTLAQVIADFNQSQYYYDATWSEGKITMEDRFPKTPGYGLDEIDEQNRSGSPAPFEENKQLLTPDYNFDEPIRTPGHDLDIFMPSFSPFETMGECPENMENERPKTQGYNLDEVEINISGGFVNDATDLFRDAESPTFSQLRNRGESSEENDNPLEKKELNWSPTFQFGTSKKRKNLEPEEDLLKRRNLGSLN